MKALFVALSVAFGFPFAMPAYAEQPRSIDIAMLAPSALVWVHAVALQQGFYEKHGIAVHELRASDSPALLQAVSSGSAAVGFALGDLAVRAIDKDAPIVMAGALLDHSILRLYSAKSIEKIQDLAGKNVTAGAVKGGTADLLRYELKRAGVDPGGVRMVSIANSRDRIIAMRNGQVSGALLIAPFDTLAERDGAHLLDVYREPYVETPLVFNKSWAAKNPTLAKDLADALKEAAAWMNRAENKDAVVAALAHYTNTPIDICAASYAFILGEQKAVPADLSVTAAGLEDIYKIDAAINGGQAPNGDFPLQRYYDPKYVSGH